MARNRGRRLGVANGHRAREVLVLCDCDDLLSVELMGNRWAEDGCWRAEGRRQMDMPFSYLRCFVQYVQFPV